MQLITALIIIFIIGAVFGSFACCQAWRLRLKAQSKKSPGSRSVCMHCHKKLKWYDNIPIISWLFLRGKCRYCKKPIGAAEILTELGMGLSFVGASWSYFSNFHPDGSLIFILQTTAYIVLLVMLVVLGILAVYDAKWGELPLFLLIISIICGIIVGVVNSCIKISAGADPLHIIISALVGVLLLAGLYFLFYKISHERWMGGGDWLLALGIACALSNWWLALWVLFLSNLIGSLVMLPSAVKHKNHKVHFGPFMVIAFVLVVAFSQILSSMMIMI